MYAARLRAFDAVPVIGDTRETNARLASNRAIPILEIVPTMLIIVFVWISAAAGYVVLTLPPPCENSALRPKF